MSTPSPKPSRSPKPTPTSSAFMSITASTWSCIGRSRGLNARGSGGAAGLAVAELGEGLGGARAAHAVGDGGGRRDGAGGGAVGAAAGGDALAPRAAVDDLTLPVLSTGRVFEHAFERGRHSRTSSAFGV